MRKIPQEKIDEARSTLENKLASRDQKILANSIVHLGLYQEEYEGDFSVIDPSGCGQIEEIDALAYDGVNVLCRQEEPPVDRIMVLDIEAPLSLPDKTGLICLYNPEGPDADPKDTETHYKIVQDWNTTYTYKLGERGPKKGKIKREFRDKKDKDGNVIKKDERGNVVIDQVHTGGVDLIENELLMLPLGRDTKPITINCYAHYGSGFDWYSLAIRLISNFETDPIYEVGDKDKILDPIKGTLVDRPTKRQAYFYDPEIEHLLNKHLYASGTEGELSSIVRRRTVDVVKTPIKRTIFRGYEKATYVFASTKRVDWELMEETPLTPLPDKYFDIDVKITDGVGESRYITWKLKPNGGSYYIEVSISSHPNKNGGKKHKIRLLDSMSHLHASLRKMGGKGETPFMFLDHEEWMREQVKNGNVDISDLNEGISDLEEGELETRRKQIKDRSWAYWKKRSLDKENVDYVKNDCRLLYDNLIRYSKTYGMVVKHPETGKPVDPLSFLTVTQAALSSMIILSAKASPNTPYNYAIQYYPSNKRRDAENPHGKQAQSVVMEEDLPALINRDLKRVKVPFLPRSEPSYCFGGWYQFGKYSKVMRPVSLGGRTENFQFLTRLGYRKVSIDRRSMYASIMADNRKYFADPRYLKFLDSEKTLKGRDNILYHLRYHSGVYHIRTMPPINPIIRDEFPIFPIKLANTDYESKAVYGTWEDKIEIRVSGEELRYFLEMTEVENDDIEVLHSGTCFSTLIPAHVTPFYHFAGEFYKLRKQSNEDAERFAKKAEKAKARGDLEASEEFTRKSNEFKAQAQFAKMQLVSGGFGVLLQQDTYKSVFAEGQDEKNLEKFEILRALTPSWSGWDDLTDDGIKVRSEVNKSITGSDVARIDSFGSKAAINLAERWAVDHYKGRKRDDIDRSLEGFIVAQNARLILKMPSKLSAHAIPAFGIAITSHARVELHKAIVAVRSVPGFRVLYCDTDSVHFEVPETMPDEEVAKILGEIKVKRGDRYEPQIKLGNDLGDWQIEPIEANPHLIDEDDPDFDPNNVRALYLAPKHYYIMSQPKPDGSHVLYKETVKGIHQQATNQRVTCMSLHIDSAKLGDHKVSAHRVHGKMDLKTTLEAGTNQRRIFTADLTAQSKPVVIKQSIKKPGVLRNRKRKAAGQPVTGAPYTIGEYMQDVARETLREARKSRGINAALDFYFDEVVVKKQSMLTVGQLRDLIEREIDAFVRREANRYDKGKLVRANAVLDRLKKCENLVNKEDPRVLVHGLKDTA